MNTVYPSYYKKFRCIGGACRHNCCIGWEIDIDSDTYGYYKEVGGDMGARLFESIAHEETPHFVLGEGERCPFLNKDNLCDIIIGLGEERLCDICAAHPRFRNELPDRCEVGIGLCCEEAARIILCESEPMTLVGAPKTDDEIIILRDRIISALQNREKPVAERVCDMLTLAHAKKSERSLAKWREILLSLERLDESWTSCLERLSENVDFEGFDRYMKPREREYEQVLVYFIYRHFANAPDMYEAAARAAFAALGYRIIHALGAAMWTEKRQFTAADQTELCRMFSSEVEYSDENLYILLDELQNMP